MLLRYGHTFSTDYSFLRRQRSRTFDVRSIALKAGRWLLHFLRRIWLRYAYPCFLFFAGMQQRGVVLAVCYNLMMLIQVLPAFLSGGRFHSCSEKDSRPCVHFVSALVFAVALIARGVLKLLVCVVDCCEQVADSLAMRILGLGDVSTCSPGGLLTEIMGLSSALLSFLLSLEWVRGVSSEAAIRSWIPSEWVRFLPVCILLVVSASLDFNVFAAVYHTAAILLLLLIAWASQRSCLCCALCVFRTVLFVAVLHLVASRVLQLPDVASQLPETLVQFLGGTASDFVRAQWISTFLLIQVILWKGLRLHENFESIVSEGSSIPGGGTGSQVPVAQPQAGSSAEGPSVATSSVVLELELTGGNGVSSRTLGSRLSPRRRIQGAPFQAGTARVIARTCEEFASRLLPLLSFLLWSIACPALSTVPLLISGVVLMHRPLSKPSRWLLHLALIYESAVCILLHSTLAMCSAWQAWAPCELFRSGRFWVLLHWDGDADRPQQSLRSFQQALAVLLLALGMRCAAQLRAAPLEEQPLAWAVGLRRWAVCALRLVTLAAVLAAVAAPGGPSLVGLGYVLWLLAGLPLSSCAQGFAASGWSGLRGSSWIWRILLLYSQAALIALYIAIVWWLKEEPADFERAIGFDTAISTLTTHIVVAVLASLQLAAFQAKVQLPAYLLDASSPLAWLAWRFGVFVQMALVFAIVLQDPKSVVSFTYLLLFIGIAAMEQFRGIVFGFWHRRLFILTAVLTAVLSILMYVSALPSVSAWLVARLGPTWTRVWGESSYELSKHKLLTMVVLQLHSSCLYRVFCHRHAALMPPDGEDPTGINVQPAALRHCTSWLCSLVPEALQRVLLTVRRYTRGWSECALLLVAFPLMFRADVLAVLQLLLLLALMVRVSCWRFLGTFISICAMFSLLAQYLFRFPESQEDWGYWGVLWEPRAVQSEVVLLLLGIVQRALHSAPDAYPDAETVHLPTMLMTRFGVHLTASLLALLALFHATAWSIPYLAIVAMFTLSADSSTALSAEQTKRWLRLVSMVLTVSLASSWLLGIWLPPGVLEKPGAKTFADSPICKMFDGHALLESNGTVCDGHVLPDCQTQRAHCGEEWEVWLGLGQEAGRLSRSLPEFLVLFVVCLVRKACLRQAQTDTASSEQQVSASSSGAGRSDDVTSDDRREAGFGAVWSTALMLCISLVGAFTFHAVASAISLTYVVLLFSYLNTVHTTLSQVVPEEDTDTCLLDRQVRTLRRLRRANLLALMLAVLFQVPSTPCPYPLPLEDAALEAGPVTATMYTTREQCKQLEANQITFDAQAPVFEEPWVGLLLQCIGVVKSSSWFFIWNWLVFSSALAHALAFSSKRQELELQVRAGHRRIERRRRLYAEHLRKWCRLELGTWETKQSVLLVRLDLLMMQLHELREFWENKRSAPCQEIQARQKHSARVLDLLLQSSASWMVLRGPQRSLEWGMRLKALYDEIDKLLQEFEEAASSGLLEQGSPHGQHVAAEAAEVYLLEYLAEKQDALKWQLHESTEAQAEEHKQAKLEVCRQQVSGSREQEPSGTRLQQFLSRTLTQAVDDLIFVSDDDPELHTHRQEDGLVSLLTKAVLSQTHFLLVAVAVLQFAYSCSVCSAITVCAVVLSLMAFPHAPALFWHVLQWYNVIAIVAKITFQLPVFCSDGSVALHCERSPLPPWLVALGFVKVDASQGVDSGYLVATLWFDVLVCVLLFAHCHVLCRAGRLGSPLKLRQDLAEGGEGPGSPASEASEASTPSSLRSAARSPGPSPAGADAEREGPSQASRLWSAAVDGLVGSARLLKPARDLYAARFVLLFLCLVLVIVFWSSMVGSGRTLEGALSHNSFSLGNVFAIVGFVALLIADRAFYTASTQLRLGEGHGTRECTQLLLADVRGTEEPPSVQASVASEAEERPEGSYSSGLSTAACAAQRLLLGAQLFALHLACILVWRIPKTGLGRVANLTSFLEGNLALFVFYCLYMAFLSLTALQLKHNIHVTRGGHMLTHSTQFSVWLMFKVYQNIPFMEEVRVLTDWTITTTSLNFWMWMKIEDAQQNLYQVKCDMEARRLVKPYDPRPTREKLLQGAALLLGLYLLIVGPIAFFSPLNALVQPNLVVSGALSASLRVEAVGKGVKTVRLYDAAQNDIQTLTDDAERGVISHFADLEDKRLTVQHVTFPTSSDTFWQVTASLQQQLAESLSLNSSRAYIMLGYTFDRNSTSAPSTVTPPPQAEMTRRQMDQLMHVLNGSAANAPGSAATVAITVPNVYVSTILLDATSVAKPAARRDAANASSANATLTLAVQKDMVWSLEVPCGRKRCPLSVDLASRMVSIFGNGGGSSSSSGTNYWSVTGMYSFVLFVVGSFLRSVFKDSSKRMIWEELQDTDVLEGLCSGIYLARMKRQLDREYTLYYLLVRIYRSPELLFKVSRPKVPLDPNEELHGEHAAGTFNLDPLTSRTRESFTVAGSERAGGQSEELASSSLRHRELGAAGREPQD